MMTEWTKEQQKEHRRLWVEALRSGKYQQTTGCLRNEDGFCCLGVACDVSKVGTWDGERNVCGEHLYSVGDEMDDTALPSEVAKWLGLATTTGAYAMRHSGSKISLWQLWQLNDLGRPFAEIADIIESEPEGLLSP